MPPSLTSDQVEQFRREGYLLVKGLLKPAEDLDPVYHEYAGVLDDLAKLLTIKARSRRHIRTCRSASA